MKFVTWVALFLFPFFGQAATVIRLACASPGGTDSAGNVWQADAFYTGGARWDATSQAALAALDLPYRALRYSSPTGSAFSYSIPVPAADYVLKLYLEEPNKTAAGQRVFNVLVNGAVVKAGLDLFAETGGALKPYVLTIPLTSKGSIDVKLVPVAGTMNGVLNGIQVDSVPPPPPPALSPGCEFGLGDGSGAMFSTFGEVPTHLVGCWNTGSAPRSIESVRCWSDGTNDTVLDVMVTDPSGTLQTILAAPILCPALEESAIVPVLAGASLPANRRLHFFVRIMAPAAGQLSPKQIVWVVAYAQ